MGLLGDLYSTIDTGKRKLKGLLGDPVGTLQDYVFNLNEDAGRGLGLLAMSGSPVAPPTPQAQQARNALIDVLGPAMMGATVWHGSPHVFDKFDASKIGTGEGAQAYGHGLYLAENPAVANQYAQTLSRYDVPQTGPVQFAHNFIQSPKHAPKVEGALRQAYPEMSAQEIADTIAQASAAVSKGKNSSLYKVDLPDSAIAKMLDWDKPLSQQAESVRTAAQDLGLPATATGKDIYNALAQQARDMAIIRGQNAQTTLGASQAGASADLRGFGIPGIRYLDGGSRGAGAGTSNYVVFPGNESLLQILERNGQPMGGY